MNRTELVRNEMMKAMKSKDKKRKDALSMLLGALKNAEIDKRSALTETEEDVIIKKEIKQTRETYNTAPESRQDIKEEAQYRISVYQEFTEADMSKEQICLVIEETLKELGIQTPVAADKGKIMKNLMPKVKGKADGKLVNVLLTDMMKK